MPAERWRDAPGFEGAYLVSDQDRVWSVHRGGHLLRQVIVTGYGGYQYKQVTLCKPGVRRPTKIHQLVMAAFGPPQPPGHEIRHLNGDSLDCRYGNLAWGTHQENAQDMVRHGRANGPGDGSLHPRAKLTEEIVLQLRAEYAAGGITERVLAARHGVNVSTLHRMLVRKTWTHI